MRVVSNAESDAIAEPWGVGNRTFSQYNFARVINNE
jgi:hypothetical protein